jgi:hypothetical protein
VRPFVPCVVETPFRSFDPDVAAARARYLTTVMRACFNAGLSPYASHDTIPRMLAASVFAFADVGIDYTDSDADLRARGIAAGDAWRDIARAVVFGLDHGWSEGMMAALDRLQDRSLMLPRDLPSLYVYRHRSLEPTTLANLLADAARAAR